MKDYLINIINKYNLQVSDSDSKEFDEFLETEFCRNKINEMCKIESELMEKWKIRKELLDFENYHIQIPNGTEGKEYQHQIKLIPKDCKNICIISLEGLNDIGLEFNSDEFMLTGTPTRSGDVTGFITYNHEMDLDSPLKKKEFVLFINPDPKKLWKDLPSDKEDLFWKEDDLTIFDNINESLNLIISSKRGRSHRNVGSFRDDDFSYFTNSDLGWSIVSVSDGAGSYKFSRKGSEIACKSIVNFYSEYFQSEEFRLFSEQLVALDFENIRKSEAESKRIMYKGVLHTFDEIKSFADTHFEKFPSEFLDLNGKGAIEHFHCTLVFTIFKKFEYGTVFLTFSVGDCPAAVFDENSEKLTLLNWLDVGEFGGGTRFITQGNIFHSNEHPMSNRFSMNIIKDFTHLFLMTDGIYDPKFNVESNLEKSEMWKTFLSDLKGNNELNYGIDFRGDNEFIKNELSDWMEFWSPGNHDDRTLAIIFKS